MTSAAMLLMLLPGQYDHAPQLSPAKDTTYAVARAWCERTRETVGVLFHAGDYAPAIVEFRAKHPNDILGWVDVRNGSKAYEVCGQPPTPRIIWMFKKKGDVARFYRPRALAAGSPVMLHYHEPVMVQPRRVIRPQVLCSPFG